MAIIKPRKGFQGTVDTVSELASVQGRPTYKVLVKDVGVFEWLASGTVDSVNVIAGLSGVWSRVVASGTPAKVYRALVTQSGTSAPTAVVLENTLTGTPVFAYTSPGVYTLTLASEWAADKTFARLSNNTATNASFGIVRTSANVLTLSTLNTLDAAANDLMTGTPLEIIVYP